MSSTLLSPAMALKPIDTGTRMIPHGCRMLGYACLLGLMSVALAQSNVVTDLEIATRRGDVNAMLSLASLYELGDGVPASFVKANQLYCEAARQGSADALLRLGVIYANGRGVPRDQGVAAALFEAAAGLGHEHAKRLLGYMLAEVKTRPAGKLPSCLTEPLPVSLRMSPELSAPGRRPTAP